MNLSPLQRNRLERALDKNGFILPRGEEAGWLTADAQYAHARAWIRYADEPGGDSFLIAIREPHVARAFEDEGNPLVGGTNPGAGSTPPGAAAIFRVEGDNRAHATVSRLFQLARSLPDAPLQRFREEVGDLHRHTEAERLIVQRVGQNVFRDALLDLQDGRCAITGLDQPELLRASHIKPWSACDTDQDRLNPANGLLLAAHWDAAFDRGLITFEADGSPITSSALTDRGKDLLGLNSEKRPHLTIRSGQEIFLAYHRAAVWR